MKIDYTNFLNKYRTVETDPARIHSMSTRLSSAISKLSLDVDTRIIPTYYTDGVIKVVLNGEYYNCFDSNTGKWFSGSVGDYAN